ncbi:MAG: right-handed parallel beta-helix repeat-containing protein [Candidatus Hodarchaeales archaeon]|jgi:parallel beta-helix repeat protein
MKTRIVILFALLVASATLASINNNSQMLSSQSILDIDQVENTFLINGQKITILFQQDIDGLRLILDGKGQSLIFDSFDFIEDIKQPIKSISIINAPRSNITGRDKPVTLIDSHHSTIANNTITDITNSSSYAYGIMLINSPNSVIYNNTIFNLTSTINSASGIHLVNSENTTIKNNTIEKIASSSTGFFDPRDIYGVLINSSSYVQIFDTRIENLDSHGHGYGIFAESSPNIEINDSFIVDINSSSSHGIYIADSQTTLMKNNTITNIISSTQVSLGISLEDSPNSITIFNNITIISGTDQVGGVSLYNSNNSIVGNNSIQTLTSTSHLRFLYGIGLKSSETIKIEWNNLLNLNSSGFEAIAIYSEESKDLEVKNNTITNVTSSFGLYFINSDDLIISWNNLTNVQNWIYIDETSNPVLYSHNIVDGQNITLQYFSKPADLVFLEGDTTNSISWVASDPKADNYTIYKDGVLIDNGTWTNGSPIDHPLDYSLTVGVTHSYQIVLTESTGFNITDYVDVTVSEVDLPQIVDSPVDLYIGLETTNQVLSWTLTDSHPANYTIYRNKEDLDPKSWTSSLPINYNISEDINFLGVYNYTIVADDTSGNTVKDTVFVFVLNTTDVSIISPHYVIYEYGETGNVLNWTVISAEGGTYTIYQVVSETTKTEITTGAFNPGEPVLHPVDGLSAGLHNFSIVVKSEGRPPIEDYFIVRVSANPDIPSFQDTEDVTHQKHSIPPYLTRPPPNPWPPIIMGGFLVAASCISAYWYVTRRLMVPSSVKIEKKAIKKARGVKDIHEEGKRLGAIGRVYFEAGSYKKAIKSHKQALAIFKKVGNKKAQIKELESLGNAYVAQGVEEKHD